MNPRKNYEEGDTETTRAYISLFRKQNDQFQFDIDGHDDENEVRSHLTPSDIEHNNITTIGITAINEQQRFETLQTTLENMGVSILETNEVNKQDDYIGSYTAYTLKATAPETIQASWNMPHLVIYGSLTPEIEECCYAAFGQKYTFENIRNHYLVFGEGLTEEAKTTLATAVQNSTEFFEEDQRYAVSSIRKAELI